MQYSFGTVSIERGSNVVIGIGTQWLANAPVGAPFAIEKDNVSYQIALVVSDNELRLSVPYEGVGGQDLFYAIHTSFTPKRGYPILNPGDIEGLLILNRSVLMIDNDMPAGGAAGVQNLGDLIDVDLTGARTGYALIRQADGKWMAQAVATGSIDLQNAGTAVSNSAAILRFAEDVLSLRRIVGEGILIDEESDYVRLSVESPGEINTMKNLGAIDSYGLYKQKSNAEFQLFALKEGAGIRITQEGDNIVIASTVTSGGTGTVIATTASNVGTGSVKIWKTTSSNDIKLRSLNFDPSWFEVLPDLSDNFYTIKGKAASFKTAADADFSDAVAGSYIFLDEDGKFKASPFPQLGIKSLSEDLNPKLSASLDASGQKILGLSRNKTIVLEKPKQRRYPIEISNARDENLLSVTCYTEAGTVQFSIVVNDTGEDSQQTNGIFGAASTSKNVINATTPVPVSLGSTVDLKIGELSADASWLALEINSISV